MAIKIIWPDISFPPLNLWNFPEWRFYYMSDGYTDILLEERQKILKELQEKSPHSSHYRKGKIEPIEVIEDWGLGFCLGNAIKYIARADYKGSKKQDLEKAKWYLEREIAKL